MGGDHSGRQAGRDDDSYPSYVARSRGSEGFQERAWESETSSWDRSPEPAGASGGGDYLYDPGTGYGAAADPYDTRATGTVGGYGATTGQGGYETATGQSGYGTATDQPAYGAPAGRHSGWYDEDPGDVPVRAAAGADGDDRGRRDRRSAARDGTRRGLPLWQELPLLLIIAFCVAILVRTFVLQAFYIPSGSMEDTLLAGDRVLVNKVVYHFREPARGEVVVFRAESWSPQPNLDDDVGTLARIGRALGDLVGISRPGEKDYIKRIIGLPGDRISCCDVDGRVFLNGQPLDEDYVLYNAALGDPPEGARDCRNRRFDEVVVEPGHMFVMGDHRAVSQDSRCQGQVLIDDIIGRADLIMWPSDRWGRLRAPEIFQSVPEPSAAPSSELPSPVELVFALPMLLSLRAVRAWRRSAGPFPYVGT